MNFETTNLPGVILIDPDVHRDDRGFFLESYNERRYAEAGVHAHFVQANHSYSTQGTLRGLHAQIQHPQAKLVRVIEGSAYDVAVDIRKGSPTFGRYFGAELSHENFRQLFIPAGFAHGFCVTSKICQFEYSCSDFYHAGDEIIIAWNDPQIGIPWPVPEPLLSDRDAGASNLDQLLEQLPIYTE
jgi:dTDP-4-dehydrorhamnose 3,5-epimerase